MKAMCDCESEGKKPEGILVVDDDPSVLRSVAPMLEALGHKVIFQAGSPGEALDIWQAHRDEIWLAVSDFIMPNLTGDHLALRLLADKPALKILFISGSDPETLDSAVPLVPGENFLQKPFTFADVRAVVGRAFGNRHATQSP